MKEREYVTKFLYRKAGETSYHLAERINGMIPNLVVGMFVHINEIGDFRVKSWDMSIDVRNENTGHPGFVMINVILDEEV